MCKDSAPLIGNIGSSQQAALNGIIAPDSMNSSRVPNTARRRVLVVDDHIDMLDMMEVMMQRRSFEVVKANSGAQALELAREFCPHIIVSDINMPGMNGYEMMATMRAMRELDGFKSIALSGYDARDENERSQRAGYDAQLTKPVDFEKLLQLIAAFSPID